MRRLLLKNARVFDLENQKIIPADVLIEGELVKQIARPGEIKVKGLKQRQIRDLKGKYLAPGLIDAHLHIESSMLTPLEFCRVAVLHGTTAIFVDPHEVANVRKDGIKLFLNLAEKVPLEMYVGIPSCVPATHLEDAGAEVSLEDIARLIEHPRAYGLAEMMNFPGIIHGLGDAREKVEMVFNKGKIVDGHCPMVRGEELVRYITNGKNDGVVRIMSDHESTSYDEALEKTKAGMYVAVRYGSASKDLDKILPGFIRNKDPLDRLMLCSDDLEAEELIKAGHIDRTVKRVRELILENSVSNLEQATLIAFKLASLNPGKYFDRFFKLTKQAPMGEVKEGYCANLVVLKDLKSLKIDDVIVRGRIVVKSGKIIPKTKAASFKPFLKTVNIRKVFTAEDFKIRIQGPVYRLKANVIQVIPNSLLTKKLTLEIPVLDSEVNADPKSDLAKIAVIERHKGTGKFALGLVNGLGIKKGAVACTVGHDSHNLMVVGVDDKAMADCVNYLARTGGGMIALNKNKRVFHALEVAGLMSIRPAKKVAESYKKVKAGAKKLGTPLDNIFMTLSFLALPVIPELKITDQGLVDVTQFKFINLFD